MHTPLRSARRPRLLASFAATAFALAALNAQAKGVSDDDIVNDATITTQVVTHGLGTKGQRYSPLDQVNTETVKNLVPVWSFSFGGEKQRGQQSQPLIHDGKMYVTASYSRIFALDATGPPPVRITPPPPPLPLLDVPLLADAPPAPALELFAPLPPSTSVATMAAANIAFSTSLRLDFSSSSWRRRSRNLRMVRLSRLAWSSSLRSL